MVHNLKIVGRLDLRILSSLGEALNILQQGANSVSLNNIIFPVKDSTVWVLNISFEGHSMLSISFIVLFNFFEIIKDCHP